MSNTLTASGITNNQVTLNYEIDNTSRDFSVFAFIFLAEGELTQAQIEASFATYLIQTRGLSPFEQLNSSITRTGLSPNTTYSFMYSVQRDNTFDPAEVIFRRPLSPPGRFTTLGPPIYTDSTISSPGTVGVSYSDGVSASSVVSFSLAAGSLPPGLSLSASTGSITGTPTTAGTYSFTVSANNTYGSTTLPLSLTINPAAPVWIDQTISSPALKDSPYSDGVLASNGATYSISAGSLPTGISLNASTGAITGTPTVVQTSNFTIQATNVTGTITVGLTLQIIEGLAPPVFTDAVLSTDLRRGIAYSDAVAATDATNYATSGTFVPGLTLNATTGAVAGTPTAQGTYSFNIIASNASGSATAPFTLPVKPGARRWDGSAWVRADRIQRWDGSAFVNVGFVKRWDGSAWVNADD